ncbi:MAG: N-acetyl-gamma-glutamyl-phosphate reductase, partial [Chitinophagaceae bacterium]
MKIQAGIIGGAGYTGGELIRLLLNHPGVNISFIHSRSHAGNPVHTVHQDLLGDTDLQFTGDLADDIDVLFLCLGHGESHKFLTGHTIPDNIRVIDLANDFRLHENSKL